MRGWSIAWVLAGMLLGIVACNGGGGGKDPRGNDQVIVDGKAGEGVIKRFSGISKQDDAVVEGQASILFDVQHVDRLVNKEVSLEVFPAGQTTGAVGKVKGNESLAVTLPVDTTEASYDIHVVYQHSELTRYEGKMIGVVAHAGRNIKYKVKLEAPIGFIDLRFLNDGVDVGSKVTYEIYQTAAEDGAGRGDALLSGVDPREMLAVPAATYDVKAAYLETETIQQEAWIEVLVIEGAMARLVHEYDFAVTLHGFILHVKNFGEDVSDKSTVYFYAPGANTEFAVAQDRGPAGERLVIKPGIYDVRAVYQPGPDKTTWGDKVLRDVEIGFEAKNEAVPADGEATSTEGDAAPAEGDVVPAEGEAAGEGEGDAEVETTEKSSSTLIELEVDVEKPLGTLVIKPLFGGADVSEKSMLRALYAGADKSAASAVLAVTGLGTHVIPAGDYDILISYEESDLRGRIWFDGVHFEHGTVWEQEVELREGGQ